MANSPKIKKVTRANLISAVIFLFILAIAGTALYLWLTDRHLEYLSSALKNWRFYTSPIILETIKENSLAGLFAVLFNQSLHLLTYICMGMFVSFAATTLYYRYQQREQQKVPFTIQDADDYNPGQRKISVLLRPNPDIVVSNLYPERYINLKRQTIKPKNPPTTPLAKFEIALFSILSAYKDWSCDPAGHHANVGLLQHSINVAKQLKAKLPNEPLTRTIGLAHDIGKILAYEQKMDNNRLVWHKKTRNHEQLSAQIIRMLPEFRRLEESHRVIINSVLSFMHHPQELPKYLSDERTFQLIKYLRIADGLATQQDQAHSKTNANREDIVDTIGQIVPKLISGLNINQVIPDKHANGWTNPIYDFVAILEQDIRTNLKGLINIEMEEALSLRMPIKSGHTHPATIAIFNALRERDYIFTEYRDSSPEHGLFSIQSGTIDFYGVFLFKRNQLENIIPEKLHEWGKCKYKIKIKNK